MKTGPHVNDILEFGGDLEIAIATTATVYSVSFKLVYGEYFGITYLATSDGTVSLTIELEQSWVLPATEGSSDDNWVVPEGMAAIHTTLSGEVQHLKSITPIPAPYGRLKITGVGSNHSSTTLRARLLKTESV